MHHHRIITMQQYNTCTFVHRREKEAIIDD